MPPDTVLEHEPWLGIPDTAEDALILVVVLSALDDEAAYLPRLKIVDDGRDASCSRLESA